MRIMKPLYIFDLDGTLADISHRRWMLDDHQDKDRWRRFYDACDKDKPRDSVIKTLGILRHNGCDVWIFSGRSSEVREKTVEWLVKNTTFMSFDLDVSLVMRDAGDYTPDDKLKELWLRSMLDEDRNRLVAVFDDRKRVVDMWRSNGITCFQVDDGDF